MTAEPCFCCCFAEAVKNIVQVMGMQVCERSDKVAEGKSSHTLYLAGMYRGMFLLCYTVHSLTAWSQAQQTL